MAKLPDIVVSVQIKTDVTFWQALKLRLSGAGQAIKELIELDIQRESDALELDRFLS
jgi:hypothetical protein